MSSLVKQKMNDAKHFTNPMWDVAISEAKDKLNRTLQAARGLRKAIANLTRLRDSGQPWPREGVAP
jgi:hypothetical protein